MNNYLSKDKKKKSQSKFDFKFYIGILMIITGLAFCFNFFGIAIGLPIFLGGIVCIGLSRKKLWIRLTAMFATFVIWYPIAFYIFHSLESKMPPAIYLIPKDFKSGHFRVDFETYCGTVPKTENGKIVYEIPDNGILAVKQEYIPGNLDAEFYLVDNNGNRKKIELDTIHHLDNPNVIRPTVYFLGMKGVEDRRGNFDTGSKNGNQYQLFLFYNEDGIIPADFYHDTYQYSLMDALTQEMRREVIDAH